MNAWQSPHLCRYIPGGIAQEAFYIQLFNIILPNAISLFNAPHPFFLFVFSHRARTQAMADQLMHPPPFQLPLRVANIVRTVALSCLYMPVLPVSVVLGLLATIVSYLVDHFLVFRVCAKPPEFGLAAFSCVFYFLRLLPLAWLILMQFVFFPRNKFDESDAPEVCLPPPHSICMQTNSKYLSCSLNMVCEKQQTCKPLGEARVTEVSQRQRDATVVQVTAPFVLGVAIWAICCLLPLQRWLGLDEKVQKNKTEGAKHFRCSPSHCLPGSGALTLPLD